MSTEVHVVETPTHGRVLVRRGHASDARYLFGFHGYLENADIQMTRLAAIPGSDRWTLVSVQALSRVYRGRTEEIAASWMTRQDRDHAIADNVRYADAVIAKVVRTSEAEAEIVHVGFSQGAAMAFRAATRAAAPAAGVVSICADVPPELLADRSVVFPPVLFARGRHDEWMTQEKFDRDLAALRERGADVHPLVFDGGHEWTEEVCVAVGEFVARFAGHV